MAEPEFELKKPGYRPYILRFSETFTELGAGEMAVERGGKLGLEGLGAFRCFAWRAANPVLKHRWSMPGGFRLAQSADNPWPSAKHLTGAVPKNKGH